jgi:hypothetical protein
VDGIANPHTASNTHLYSDPDTHGDRHTLKL